MIFDWYKVINKAEFEATNLISQEVQVLFEGIGLKTVLVTKANLFSITVDDVILSFGLTDANPFIFEERAIFVDSNYDVWYGILTDES